LTRSGPRSSNCFALRNPYSITSSARSRIDCGTVKRRHDCDPLEAGHDLREQLKPFTAGESSKRAMPVELLDDAAGDGVG
jgi:hypothetical protein